MPKKINPIVAILMARDNLTRDEAEQARADARELVSKGHDPEEILHCEFSLEPDYIFDLLE